MRRENSNGWESYWQWPATLAERIPQVWFVWNGATASTGSADNAVELLDIHAQSLVAGRQRPSLLPQADDEIAALSHLAEDVARLIRPIQPAPTFRRELRQALLSTHRQQAAQRRLFAHPLFEKGVIDRSLLERLEINSPLFWQIAAAVPVLIAVAALLWRFSRRPGQQAEKLVA